MVGIAIVACPRCLEFRAGDRHYEDDTLNKKSATGFNNIHEPRLLVGELTNAKQLPVDGESEGNSSTSSRTAKGLCRSAVGPGTGRRTGQACRKPEPQRSKLADAIASNRRLLDCSSPRELDSRTASTGEKGSGRARDIWRAIADCHPVTRALTRARNKFTSVLDANARRDSRLKRLGRGRSVPTAPPFGGGERSSPMPPSLPVRELSNKAG